MTRLLVALITLACVFACVFSSVGTQRATAQDDKRVAELEKKVADLEKKVSALEALLKVSPKPELDLKLVGSWAASKPKGKGIVAMRFEADGKCRVVISDEKEELETWLGDYELTGKVLQLTISPRQFSASVVWKLTVVSLDGKHLVVKGKFATGNFVVTDEVKLEKQ